MLGDPILDVAERALLAAGSRAPDRPMDGAEVPALAERHEYCGVTVVVVTNLRRVELSHQDVDASSRA